MKAYNSDMGLLDFIGAIFEAILLGLERRRQKTKRENVECDRESNPLLRDLEI